VTALAFSETGGLLLSGGADTAAALWLVADAVDSGGAGGGLGGGGWGAQAARVEPLHTWWVPGRAARGARRGCTWPNPAALVHAAGLLPVPPAQNRPRPAPPPTPPPLQV
jgi:hypothetical protein